MKHRAVLFDLDGTLLDSIDDLADSMNAVLSASGFPEHPVDAYKRFVGDGVENLIRRALPEAQGDEESIARGLAAMRREYTARWNVKTRPYQGIPEMLDALTERGVVLAVLSNKLEELTKMAVRELLADWNFALVRGARPDVPKKPDPEGAFLVARELDIPPDEFLYLGDTDTDMRTAVSAGMYPCGALWGFRDEEELRASGAKALLHLPTDLLPLL